MAKKSNAGRHTVMTPEVIRKLEEAFANGATDLQACFYAGISKTPFYDYQEKHPEFKERKEGLKDQLGLIAKNQVAKAIKGGDVTKAQWYLEKKDPEFSTKVDKNVKTDTNLSVSLAESDKKLLRDMGIDV